MSLPSPITDAIAGTEFVRDFNDTRETLRAFESGKTPPANPVKGQFWGDARVSDRVRIRQRSNNDWVLVTEMVVGDEVVRMVLDNDHDTFVGQSKVTGQFGIWCEGAQAFAFSSSGLTLGTAASADPLDLSAKSGALLFPRGAASERPAVFGGLMWWNESTQRLEGSSNSAWADLPTETAQGSTKWGRGSDSLAAPASGTSSVQYLSVEGIPSTAQTCCASFGEVGGKRAGVAGRSNRTALLGSHGTWVPTTTQLAAVCNSERPAGGYETSWIPDPLPYIFQWHRAFRSDNALLKPTLGSTIPISGFYPSALRGCTDRHGACGSQAKTKW